MAGALQYWRGRVAAWLAIGLAVGLVVGFGVGITVGQGPAQKEKWTFADNPMAQTVSLLPSAPRMEEGRERGREGASPPNADQGPAQKEKWTVADNPKVQTVSLLPSAPRTEEGRERGREGGSLAPKAEDLETIRRSCRNQVCFYCKHQTAWGLGCDHATNPMIARAAYEALVAKDSSIALTVIVGGVNKGQGVSMLLDEMNGFKDKFTVFGFDLAQSNLALVRDILDKRRFQHTLLHAGMSDREGEVCTAKPSNGTGKVLPNQNPNTSLGCKHGYSINLTTIEKVSAQRNIVQTFFSLIDVEGHELNVIFGMGLERNALRFPVIQYEIDQSEVRAQWTPSNTHHWSQAKVAQYLGTLGYTLFLMGCKEGGSGAQWTKPTGGFLLRVHPWSFKLPLLCKGGCPHKMYRGNILAVHSSILSSPPMKKLIAQFDRGAAF